MPIFVWWFIVVVLGGFSAQILLDDKTVVQQVSEPIESTINLFASPLLFVGIGLMLLFMLKGIAYIVRAYRREQ